jgi:hypothetical protein
VGQDIDGDAAYDLSGSSITMSADMNRVAMGAYGNGSNSPGHVCIYDLDRTAWTQVGKDIDGEESNGKFGWSVAMLANRS